MLAQETWVNETEHYTCGESGLYEPFTDNLKRLFRAYQRQYGRCISKVYIDTAEGSKPIGWVFQKIAQYEDTHDPYLQEAWVTLHNTQPKVTTQYDYHFLEA